MDYSQEVKELCSTYIPRSHLDPGGMAFFSGRYGFACNSITAYEVILGNGTTVTAKITQNSRLFRALKGGSNTFGVVTRFDANLFRQDAFWGSQIIHPITSKEAYFSFVTNFTQSSSYDPFAALISVFVSKPGVEL